MNHEAPVMQAPLCLAGTREGHRQVLEDKDLRQLASCSSGISEEIMYVIRSCKMDWGILGLYSIFVATGDDETRDTTIIMQVLSFQRAHPNELFREMPNENLNARGACVSARQRDGRKQIREQTHQARVEAARRPQWQYL